LQLVQRVNATAVQLGRDFNAWVGPVGLSGNPIPYTERPSIEAIQALRICEVPESDDEESDEEEAGADPKYTATTSRAIY
jgi:hypothetical protein